MSDAPEDDTPSRPTSRRAQQLFGTKGGARAWDDDRAQAPPPAPPKPPVTRQSSASDPYPQEASYVTASADAAGIPRPAPPAPPVAPGAVDEDGELTRLHPNYKLLMRVGAVISGLVIAFVSLAVDAVMQSEGVPIPPFIITGAGLILALFIIIRMPHARFQARGYQMGADRLRVVRGVLWHSDTIVPFGRVQHIDVDQGPIERALGIATMTLHTAGSHNASVQLPGLGADLARDMREDIRAHIKRETM